MQFTIKQGMNQDILKSYPDNHFDSIVTDPPYGIEFLGKDWDSNTGAVETWEECYRVLKPGGHILAFSAARTYHKLATNIESVGFEIRDQLMWLYASGFPKAQDIGKAIQKRQGVVETTPQPGTNAFKLGANGSSHGISFGEDAEFGTKNDEIIPTSPEAQQWSGWKTALKPAHEPIVMARKPFKGSCLDNVLKHGTGALNIDASRVEYEKEKDFKGIKSDSNKEKGKATTKYFDGNTDNTKTDYDKVDTVSELGRFPSNVFGEIEDYQKFFFCPKVQRAERHIGFDNLPKRICPQVDEKGHIDMYEIYDKQNGESTEMTGQKNVGNNHPTVKPVALMSYLVKLVTPPGGKVLDPFNGSGSTGMACVEHGFEYTGCELDPAYVEIATKRIEAWYKHIQPKNNYNELFDGEIK